MCGAVQCVSVSVLLADREQCNGHVRLDKMNRERSIYYPDCALPDPGNAGRWQALENVQKVACRDPVRHRWSGRCETEPHSQNDKHKVQFKSAARAEGPGMIAA